MQIEIIKKEIYSMGKKISTTDSRSLVYEIMLDSAMSIISKANRGSVLVLEEDNYFHYRAIKGYPTDLLNMKIKREDVYLYKYNKLADICILKMPFNDKDDLFNDNISGKIQLLEKGPNIKSVLFSPIYVDNKVVAIVNLDSTAADALFNKGDISKMKYINHELELALKNFLSQEQLRYIATHDELTNLYNRRSFKDYFSREILEMQRKKHISHVALIDLDDFKFINDNYGHSEGDKALIIMSEALRINLNHNDLYARMSGDEFVILFRNSTLEQAIEKIMIIKDYLLRNCTAKNHIDFSYGLVQIDGINNLSIDEILCIADKNMYKDKRERKCKNECT
ncbi:sensor domain-containing diguanylate cyclase [Clostridium folliculivorans]|uniref:GGDEF domain-containing protein n=2 Tax=Clostridium folliculivorans TaxID=2886038 RepID=A0A9W6DBB5_9CLOT|nr:sensor domain-containing diguanylate cyclase [Clostridium folliculivorans]GKU26099.1 GGDEF domain-containing protein [Clostridium folliculivorans]GKU28185.1 GGDEF domain-containing protein [Clostridium folliculivorans]